MTKKRNEKIVTLAATAMAVAAVGMGVDGCRSPEIQPRQASAKTGGVDKRVPGDKVNAHTLIVFYDKTVGKEPLLKAVKEYGAKVIYDYKNFSGMAIALPDDKGVVEAKQHFDKVKGVTQVNYDHIVTLNGKQQAQ